MDKEDSSSSDKLTVKSLTGSADYSFWRRNSRAYLTRCDLLLLGLKEATLSNSNANVTKWREASVQTKGTLTLLLSDAVQVRAIEIIEDDEKTAYDLWEFLKSTYTVKNEQAVQNLRAQLDRLMLVEGSDWDDHLNKFNSLIAQLAIQEVEIDDKTKKSMIIRPLLESLSVISTVASAQVDMTVESLDALIRAELDRKKNPNNRQEKKTFPRANFVDRTNGKNGQGGPIDKNRRKKGKCHHCGKEGHFKRECRKLKAERKKNKQTQSRDNPSGQPGPSTQQQFPQTMQPQPQNFHELLSVLSQFAANNPPPPPPPPFGGFMAQFKFRSAVAQVDSTKTSDAIIDSGATHHFFFNHSAFITYTSVSEDPVKAAARVTKIVGKGTVRLPVQNGMIVEAYHAPMFSSNILLVRLLSVTFDILFCTGLRAYPACFSSKKEPSTS